MRGLRHTRRGLRARSGVRSPASLPSRCPSRRQVQEEAPALRLFPEARLVGPPRDAAESPGPSPTEAPAAPLPRLVSSNSRFPEPTLVPEDVCAIQIMHHTSSITHHASQAHAHNMRTYANSLTRAKISSTIITIINIIDKILSISLSLYIYIYIYIYVHMCTVYIYTHIYTLQYIYVTRATTSCCRTSASSLATMSRSCA